MNNYNAKTIRTRKFDLIFFKLKLLCINIYVLYYIGFIICFITQNVSNTVDNLQISQHKFFSELMVRNGEKLQYLNYREVHKRDILLVE